MAAVRRHSRTPITLTQADALLLVEAAESNAEIRESLEVFTGREWSTMTTGEKAKAILFQEQVGGAVGSVAGAQRAFRDLRSETDLKKYGVSTSDRADLLETQVAELRSKLERIDEENHRLRAENDALRAAGAMAVHSDERAA